MKHTQTEIRIRVGTQDAHTSFMVAMSLALMFDTFEETDVDYEMVWDQGHGHADYDGELLEWINEISQ